MKSRPECGILGESPTAESTGYSGAGTAPHLEEYAQPDKNSITGGSAVGSAPALGVAWRYPGQVMAKRRKALQHLRSRDFPPVAENGTKAALTTGLTTDRKIFDFPSRRGIMAEIEYPGIAKLVSRLVWDQETVRSSRTTRTKIPLKSLISGGFSYSLSIAAQGLNYDDTIVLYSYAICIMVYFTS